MVLSDTFSCSASCPCVSPFSFLSSFRKSPIFFCSMLLPPFIGRISKSASDHNDTERELPHRKGQTRLSGMIYVYMYLSYHIWSVGATAASICTGSVCPANYFCFTISNTSMSPSTSTSMTGWSLTISFSQYSFASSMFLLLPMYLTHINCSSLMETLDTHICVLLPVRAPEAQL